jgi:hypothetical protein
MQSGRFGLGRPPEPTGPTEGAPAPDDGPTDDLNSHRALSAARNSIVLWASFADAAWASQGIRRLKDCALRGHAPQAAALVERLGEMEAVLVAASLGSPDQDTPARKAERQALKGDLFAYLNGALGIGAEVFFEARPGDGDRAGAGPPPSRAEQAATARWEVAATPWEEIASNCAPSRPDAAAMTEPPALVEPAPTEAEAWPAETSLPEAPLLEPREQPEPLHSELDPGPLDPTPATEASGTEERAEPVDRQDVARALEQIGLSIAPGALLLFLASALAPSALSALGPIVLIPGFAISVAFLVFANRNQAKGRPLLGFRLPGLVRAYAILGFVAALIGCVWAAASHRGNGEGLYLGLTLAAGLLGAGGLLSFVRGVDLRWLALFGCLAGLAGFYAALSMVL